MNYREIIENARKNGRSSEDVMWRSIDDVTRLLEEIKVSHPDMYRNFMRKAHESIYGPHYDELFAMDDLSRISYIDGSGKHNRGPAFSVDDANDAFKGKVFSDSVTDYDKWVAYNSAHADFCRLFDETQIADIAYLFYFDDQDWEGDGKVWKYMGMS